MMDALSQEILNSILAADTEVSLALLEEGRSLFLDPVKGISFHAEALYCAIKKANHKVVQSLFELPTRSDIAFFKLCGNTPIGVAVEENRNELLPLLLTKTDKSFALHMAVKLNFKKTKKILLNKCSFKKKFLDFLNLKN